MLGLGTFTKSLFGTPNDRALKRMQPAVDAINGLEPDLEALSDADIRARTADFKTRLENGEPLDDLMVEAFATVREAAKRTLGQRHFDVQLMGGMVLHRGMIAEMKTGEGKTLVSTLPLYLNALAGKGAHVVTVNEYLARRDADWMGQIYRFLGLEVGVTGHGQSQSEKRAAYKADITYGTNNEYGFDYLRDNMAPSLTDMVQRDFHYAIVDEVDSILIDEARTPLIISGAAQETSDLYRKVDKIIPRMTEDDYELDEKHGAATLTEDGNEHIEELLIDAGLITEGGLYDMQNVTLVHHVNQALHAHKLKERDRDYIVKNGRVVIIDQFTGRMMEGRRWGNGLHQAVEAKEGVEVQTENQTVATITLQNYFRLYPKLAGMTGTAATEAGEFMEIYGLDVVEIPTHMPVARIDEDDEVYRTFPEKETAILDLIADCHKRGQPCLVGTVSIEKSEELSKLLRKRKIAHEVLNARYHEKEAQIIAQAGRAGAVTIATNMAGRGTDIQLGGNLDMRMAQEIPEDASDNERKAKIEEIKADIQDNREKVLAEGGLYVIGTERHESRRIDNQLRGRSGRQGDPGQSKFFLSLEDDLMRIFGSERMDSMLERMGLEEGEAIMHPWINKALEKAQKRVEQQNFEVRKNLLKFDDVMNDQRAVIYEQRRELMEADDVSETIEDMRRETVTDLVLRYIPPKTYPEQWDTHGLEVEAQRIFGVDLPAGDWAAEEGIDEELMLSRVMEAADKKMAQQTAEFGAERMRRVEKDVLLSQIDSNWRDHLQQLDDLKQAVRLRAYAQRDPLNEYKTEAFNSFEAMLEKVREDVTALLCHLQPPPEHVMAAMREREMELEEQHLDPRTGENEVGLGEKAVQGRTLTAKELKQLDPSKPETWGRVPRNAPCPCGSGKKFKHCHGKVA